MRCINRVKNSRATYYRQLIIRRNTKIRIRIEIVFQRSKHAIITDQSTYISTLLISNRRLILSYEYLNNFLP